MYLFQFSQIIENDRKVSFIQQAQYKTIGGDKQNK